MPMEERPLRAPEQRRSEDGRRARALRCEYGEAVREQSAEGERRQTEGQRVRQPPQPGGEDEVRQREEQLGQAGMLEVEAPVPPGVAQRGGGRAQEQEHPLLVAPGGLEVIALVAHEPDSGLGREERGEGQRGERERQAAGHGAVVHAARQKGRSASRALTRKANACSPDGAATSMRRQPGSGGTVGGTVSVASGAPSTCISTRTGPRAS